MANIVSLTIVVPTADRVAYLFEVIESIFREFEQTGYTCDVVIADNASQDPVNLEELGLARFGSMLSLVRFSDRVDIGNSIVRTSEIAETDYVWVFGDDDFLLPGGLQTILSCLEKKPDYLYLNRFTSPNDMEQMDGTEHVVCRPFVEHGIQGREAIRRFTHHPAFITSLIFRRGLLSLDFESSFPGYGFLASLYSQTLEGTVSYVSMPVLVQRRSETLWRQSWPSYWLNSVPALFRWLEEEKGVSEVESIAVKEVSLIAIRTSVLAVAFGYKTDDLVWQSSAFRVLPFHKRLLVMGIRYCPRFVAERIVKLVFSFR